MRGYPLCKEECKYIFKWCETTKWCGSKLSGGIIYETQASMQVQEVIRHFNESLP